MIDTTKKFYAATFAAILAMMAIDAAATVAATGDVRCIVVKCVVLKK